MAAAQQRRLQRSQILAIVIDQKEMRPAAVFFWSMIGHGGRSFRLGELERKDRALMLAIGRRYVTAARFQDVLGDGQSEAGPVWPLCSEERIEDSLEMLAGDAGSVISHGDDY